MSKNIQLLSLRMGTYFHTITVIENGNLFSYNYCHWKWGLIFFGSSKLPKKIGKIIIRRVTLLTIYRRVTDYCVVGDLNLLYTSLCRFSYNSNTIPIMADSHKTAMLRKVLMSYIFERNKSSWNCKFSVWVNSSNRIHHAF